MEWKKAINGGQIPINFLHRLDSEPRRLWKRYLVTNSLFVWGAVRQLVFSGMSGNCAIKKRNN
jgi:hypothetical protein